MKGEWGKGGDFDAVPNTLFCNAGAPGATSRDVLDCQVPEALQVFRPDVITITVGGNDLITILGGADTGAVLGEFRYNLTEILPRPRTGLPDARIFVSNQYTVPGAPGADQAVPLFNQVVSGVAGAFGVALADVYGAHPTNAGYRAMAQAFEAAIAE